MESNTKEQIRISDEYLWEPDGTGGARLLGMYGQTSQAFVPEQIEGMPVTEIGAYCFAGRGRERSEKTTEKVPLRALAGDVVESVHLPKTIRRIGSYAFYQCTRLERLSLYGSLCEVGGDAFMNCHRLHTLTVETGDFQMEGVRQMLAQLSLDIEVSFLKKGTVCARLLFPEYYESYDEIAPAHVFGRNIEGEGFRARQCVRAGEIDFALYDSIFQKACAEERETTLNRLALNRLCYPVGLTGEKRQMYESYIKEHAGSVCAAAVCGRDEETVLFLCEQRLLTAAQLDDCIRLAAEEDWAKGAASFLRMKEQVFKEKTIEERYSFDAFE